MYSISRDGRVDRYHLSQSDFESFRGRIKMVDEVLLGQKDSRSDNVESKRKIECKRDQVLAQYVYINVCTTIS